MQGTNYTKLQYDEFKKLDKEYRKNSIQTVHFKNGTITFRSDGMFLKDNKGRTENIVYPNQDHLAGGIVPPSLLQYCTSEELHELNEERMPSEGKPPTSPLKIKLKYPFKPENIVLKFNKQTNLVNMYFYYDILIKTDDDRYINITFDDQFVTNYMYFSKRLYQDRVMMLSTLIDYLDKICDSIDDNSVMINGLYYSRVIKFDKFKKFYKQKNTGYTKLSVLRTDHKTSLSEWET